MAENQGSSAAEKLTFLLIGGGIGATLALLFAPKTGRELRGAIADYTKRGMDVAGEQARVAAPRAQTTSATAIERMLPPGWGPAGKVSPLFWTWARHSLDN